MRSYGLTIFLSALLLFQVQLVIGKYILPFFGGTPSVWNTCMLFFQTLLLFGYGYAHLLSQLKNPRVQSRVHSTLLIASVALLAAHWLQWGSPLTPGSVWKQNSASNPVWGILELLSVTVGLPFFLLSSTAPLLQKWFSRTSSGARPYWLYALSNAGSLLGLLSYPFLIEWALTLKHQTQFWFVAYALFALMCLVIARSLQFDALASEEQEQLSSLVESAVEHPKTSQYFLWAALAACSSTMLLATTNQLCQDIAVIPLLWVWPLCIYLFSFILVFGSTQWYSRRIVWPLYFVSLVLALKVGFWVGTIPKLPMQIASYSVALFAVCMVCHGELARSKPATKYLTSFYSMLALGGALGGVFVVLLAPRIFRGFYEFQLALLGCGFLLFAAYISQDRGGVSEPQKWAIPIAALIAFLVPQLVNLSPKLATMPVISEEFYTGALAGGFLLVRARWLRGQVGPAVTPAQPSKFSWGPAVSMALLGVLSIITCSRAFSASKDSIFQERNFFGVKHVQELGGKVYLTSGSVLHGGESTDPRLRDIPTLYFNKTSGIGLLLDNYPRGSSGEEPIRIGVIGLGAGTLAAYGRPGDSLRFYEIDPTMIRIATGTPPFFHFVEDSKASVQIIEGDGRLSLQREADQGALQRFDVFAIDAFSGDAVPAHLLTREALSVYLRHLRGPDSVIAFHVSNSYLDLAPVVAGLAQSYHLHTRRVCDGFSLWILLSRNPAVLELPHLAEKSTPLIPRRAPLLWTDNYSNLFQVIQFTPSCKGPA